MTHKAPVRTDFIQRMITEQLHPVLAHYGFVRRNRVWNRKLDHIVHVIEVQEAKSSAIGNEQFTLNVGVFSARIYEVVWQRTPPKSVSETDCVIRARIGMLAERGLSDKARDIWWEINDPDMISTVSQEIASLIELKAIPFLKAIESNESMLEVMSQLGGWQKKIPLNLIYLAALNAECNRRDEARRLLDESSKNPAWQDRASAIRRTYGFS